MCWRKSVGGGVREGDGGGEGVGESECVGGGVGERELFEE